MIDDPELRALFKAESEEHLQTLENGLLRLEAEPRDTAMLEELFRSAHSLKGAARMLGVEGVETLAHHFEDELGAARRGHSVLSSAMADRLYRGLDAMRKLAREASDGEIAQVDIPQILAQLRGEDVAPAAPPIPAPPTPNVFPKRSRNTEYGGGETGIAEDEAKQLPSEMPPVDGNTVALHIPIAPEIEIALTPQEPRRSGGTQKPIGAAQTIAVAPPLAKKASNGSPIIAVEEPPAAISDLSAERKPFAAERKPFAAEGKPFAVVDEALVGVDEAFVSATTFKIETIRVEPQKLDALMIMAGEMAVTTTRIARSLIVISDLVALREEWERDAGASRAFPTALSDGLAPGARHSPGEQFARFQERETGRLTRLGHLLKDLERTSDEGITRLGLVSDALDEAIRGMRLLPFSTIFSLFPRLVRDLSREQGKEVQFVVEGGTLAADKHLLEEMKDPLMHLLRNAIDHGIELPDERIRQGKPREATLRLRAYQTASRVVLEISDDGRGLDEEAIRRAALRKHLRSEAEIAAMSPEDVQMLIFAPGFSTSPLITNVSGRGVGLDVVRANIERLKGEIAVDSKPGYGCTFRLQAPLTLATTRVLLVQVAKQSYALPIEAVQDISLVSPQDVFTMEGRATIRRDSQPISAARLADLLELPPAQTAEPVGKASGDSGSKSNRGYEAPESRPLPCILIAIGTEKLALFVDALLDEQEVILKPFDGLLQRVRNVVGATILNTGDICMVLNPHDLLKSAQKERAVGMEQKPVEDGARKKIVLLAEDSITTRTQEKRILEGAGYEVVTAVDGADAFSKLGSRDFDALVSDIEMPNMDGLALAARIRQDVKYKELPIILVTSLASDTDRRRGIQVGANAYITKGTFEQTALLDTLRRLV